MDQDSIPLSVVPPTYQETQAASQHQSFDSDEWKGIPISIIMGIATIPLPEKPDGATERRACLKWEAQLDVKTKDVPRLMREGFHWTTANCHVESTYVNGDIDDSLLEEGWKCNRKYFLSDLGEDPRWTATLTVHARDLQTAAQFRIENLRQDMVYCAVGLNAKKQWIYGFDALDPSHNFNAIYDDMPLEGWWPWPKNKGEKLLS